MNNDGKDPVPEGRPQDASGPGFESPPPHQTIGLPAPEAMAGIIPAGTCWRLTAVIGNCALTVLGPLKLVRTSQAELISRLGSTHCVSRSHDYDMFCS